jgi:hypothetical protein
MLWWFWRWVFWRPQFSYQIVVGTSHASADEAAKNAELKTNNSGGEAIGIAADAMCCTGRTAGLGDESAVGPGVITGARPGIEWNVYVLIRN